MKEGGPGGASQQEPRLAEVGQPETEEEMSDLDKVGAEAALSGEMGRAGVS